MYCYGRMHIMGIGLYFIGSPSKVVWSRSAQGPILLLALYTTCNPLQLHTDAFRFYKITYVSWISLNIRNYYLQKCIKISWQFINLNAIYSSNNYSRFWCNPVEIVYSEFLVYKLKLFTAKTCPNFGTIDKFLGDL